MNQIKDNIVSKFGMGGLTSYANIRIFEINLKEYYHRRVSKDDEYERYYWKTIIKKEDKIVAHDIKGKPSTSLSEV